MGNLPKKVQGEVKTLLEAPLKCIENPKSSYGCR